MRTVRLEAGGGDKEEMRGRGNGEKGLVSSAFGSVWVKAQGITSQKPEPVGDAGCTVVAVLEHLKILKLVFKRLVARLPPSDRHNAYSINIIARNHLGWMAASDLSQRCH
jgi:hypothetical protein